MSEKEYKVECILDDKPCKVCKRAGEPSRTVTDYLVKWKGYGPEENKWTAKRYLGNTKEVIADYLKSKKSAVTVQAIVVEPKTATVIINVKKSKLEWRYLVKKHPADEPPGSVCSEFTDFMH
ncbi:uncharacterized protein ARMOST_20361 [Armillaria ostoyae]|uniref:Chromo domain-containing protein n=1 Tax=Armillaria ostoyae TaxID=47428 RepID=A0A284S739_ARMOS|nr:uncharacterized protein ARMOST_20361 [Armillaria ostoyae]